MFPIEARILVVDDSLSARESLKNALKHLGCARVEEANDGERAVELLMSGFSASDPVEVIICDLKMPKLDGLQFLNFVRKSSPRPDLPFFLCTAEGEKAAIIEAVKSGADGYILKTVSFKSLAERIARVWDSYEARRSKA